MRKFLIVLVVWLHSFTCMSQNEQLLGVFEADTTWLKEIIPFPIGFAPEINYDGYEDLRFAKSWRAKDHPDFWSYTFAWHVQQIQQPTITELENYLKLYYDGLMNAVNKKKDYIIPNTKVILSENDSIQRTDDYNGQITMYDSFTTEDVITLNVKIKIVYCKINKETLLIFKLSPQAYDKPIWDRFNDLQIRDELCN